MNPEEVSIVICTYNRKKWLQRCLQAIEKLSPPPGEIVVVDGPSSDGTREFLEKLERAEKIKLVTQPKLEGISIARNLGMEKARGKVVCFIDDDAIPCPEWMISLISGYDSPKVGGVGGPVYYMDGTLAIGRSAINYYGDWFDASRGHDLTGLLPIMVGCNMSFRTEILRRIGGFDPYFRYHQDEADACLRVLRTGHEIRYVEKAGVRHEWCEGSYRKDRLKWYLRLRYMYGRNNAHLVHKNFPEKVSFFSYMAHQIDLAATRRSTRTISPSSEVAVETDKLPKILSLVGAAFELFGTGIGWR
ncbi:MAG: glycosyltransferase [Methanomassiliicoccales archaeon]